MLTSIIKKSKIDPYNSMNKQYINGVQGKKTSSLKIKENLIITTILALHFDSEPKDNIFTVQRTVPK